MASPVELVNSLSEVVPSTGGRLLVTLLALAFAVVVALGSRRAQRRLTSLVRPVVADVTTSVVFVLGFFVAGLVSVGVWDQADLVRDAVAEVTVGTRAAPQVVLTLAIVVATFVLTNFVSRLLDRLQETSRAITEHQREIFYRVSQVVAWATAGVVVLGLWDFDLSGLLVGAGFLGIVLGMAARQTLGAMLAGFVLMFARPFEIGDWVVVGDSEGIVTDITIVNTRIQTFDGEYVMIPNDTVSGNSIVNRTRKGRLRLEVEVGVDYETDPERAADLARETMRECETVLTVPTPQVVMKRFGDSAVVMGLRFWIDKPSARRKWRAQSEVIRSVKAAFEAEGVKIPFPQRELSGREEAGGFRVAGEARSMAGPQATTDGGEE